MKEIKKVDVVSAGKVSALIMALLGAVVGVFMVLAAIALGIYAVITGNYAGLLVFGGVLVTTIGFIIFYVLTGYIMGVLYAAIYNLIAKKWGGLKIELK